MEKNIENVSWYIYFMDHCCCLEERHFGPKPNCQIKSLCLIVKYPNFIFLKRSIQAEPLFLWSCLSIIPRDVLTVPYKEESPCGPPVGVFLDRCQLQEGPGIVLYSEHIGQSFPFSCSILESSFSFLQCSIYLKTLQIFIMLFFIAEGRHLFLGKECKFFSPCYWEKPPRPEPDRQMEKFDLPTTVPHALSRWPARRGHCGRRRSSHTAAWGEVAGNSRYHAVHGLLDIPWLIINLRN